MAQICPGPGQPTPAGVRSAGRQHRRGVRRAPVVFVESDRGVRPRVGIHPEHDRRDSSFQLWLTIDLCRAYLMRVIRRIRAHTVMRLWRSPGGASSPDGTRRPDACRDGDRTPPGAGPTGHRVASPQGRQRHRLTGRVPWGRPRVGHQDEHPALPGPAGRRRVTASSLRSWMTTRRGTETRALVVAEAGREPAPQVDAVCSRAMPEPQPGNERHAVGLCAGAGLRGDLRTPACRTSRASVTTVPALSWPRATASEPVRRRRGHDGGCGPLLFHVEQERRSPDAVGARPRVASSRRRVPSICIRIRRGRGVPAVDTAGSSWAPAEPPTSRAGSRATSQQGGCEAA
jgi:hypothetical protein